MFIKPRQHQSGVTLVELIVFIVIVSVAMAGVLKALELSSKASVNPLISKQALAIAESLLLEIEQQPFTFCDPDDSNSATATSAVNCNSDQNNGGGALGPIPTSESRYSTTAPFDNVADYNGFSMPNAECAGICSAGSNIPINGLSGYAANVVIGRVGGIAPFASVASDSVLKIMVTVTGPANTKVMLTGYRFRYAPNI